MATAAISPENLEDAILKAFQKLSLLHTGTGHRPRTEFYEKFQRAVDDHNHDFIKKYDEDLNTTLIFAGLFSAVTSAFIVDVQSDLQPDYNKMNNALLEIVAGAALGHVPSNATFPRWNGPDRETVRVQSILYSSLFASLFAALLAMLGKQWLNRYESAEFGSLVARGQLRMRKMDGMQRWKFGLVMESLPIILQIALLLLSVALADYLYSVNMIVAGTIIGFTAFGLLFYILIASAGTFSYDCPFQTPISLTFWWLVRIDNGDKSYLRRSKKWLKHRFSQIKGWSKSTSVGLPSWMPWGKSNGSVGGDPGLPMTAGYGELLPLSDQKINWDRFVLDSNCVGWMVEKPMDTDVTIAVTRFIPEIVWHDGIQAAPLEKLYDTLSECFDRSSGLPLLKPTFRDKAYFSARALLHTCIQCMRLGDRFEPVFESISRQYQINGSHSYDKDSDLESTLGIIDRIFGGEEVPVHLRPMRWQNFSFTVPHHAWLGHIFVYHAMHALETRKRLPDYVVGFLIHFIRSEDPPPAPIAADCLFIAGSVLGIKLHVNDMVVKDKSHWIKYQVDRIHMRLAEILGNPVSTEEERKSALLALDVMVSACEGDFAIWDDISQKFYDLFCTAVETPVSYTEERVWTASRLALHGAFKLDRPPPLIENPQNILAFLYHYFELTARSRDRPIFELKSPIWREEEPIQRIDEAIQDALHALTYTPVPVPPSVHQVFDPTDPNFINCIRYALQSDRPPSLRKSALLLLPRVCNQWFNNSEAIMEPGEMKEVCDNWASAIDHMKQAHDVRVAALEVLFSMINSNHWRPYISPDKWKFLEFFISVQVSQHLEGYLNDSELIDEVLKVDDPVATAGLLAILWLKDKKLNPHVQEKLVAATRRAARSKRVAFEKCLEILDSGLEEAKMELERVRDELERVGGALTQPHDTELARAEAASLMEKIEDLKRAKDSLSLGRS